ncbi:ABC transporter ATP-binding protein, partial [Rhizobium leguminosarum bv. viciae]|nr:ABC transporter ATP-binding protein [Rhizobium leguminosarum bv. viciae]
MSISVDEVSFAAGDTVIVNGVSLTVERGKVFGLLGPNTLPLSTVRPV